MTASKVRRFHIGDIITVGTGVMVAPGNLPSVRRLIQHMVNRRLLDFQLIEATDLVQPHLREAFPWLTTIDDNHIAGLPEEAIRTWLEEMSAQHGQSHLVARLPEGTWVDRDPVEELKSKMQPGATLITMLADGRGVPVILDDLKPGDMRNPPFDPED